ncbi:MULTISPECIES: FliI/YscN family ATPase [unclassified Sphingomonas]|uniref:FliI/YscN family ATPase n=1 Tax=unclassified Sphingomonas TaxID=196159 RepID=UPI0006FFEF6A|nr:MULTISPECIES: FliI/YscN family ATPase [unclassified Sphingomonas]KQM96768.1 flagellar protein export ATPase FliI [Sphingomonas sp. Leaf25]KQN39547.1 flagellar protein export ATPase FliI [Sphingomonas sp. Leaf42]KQT28824.1 flagellar protein export ATPase FliI [Sphingomonas sp. Leaf407]
MLNHFAEDYLGALAPTGYRPQARVAGRLASYDGLLMEAVGLSLPVGTVCQVATGDGGHIEAEAIGFRNGRTLMMNLGGPAPLLPGALVRPGGAPGEAEIGDALLGRVVDGAGKPIDGKGPIRGAGRWPLGGKLQSPLDRGRVLEPMDVGVRAINGLLTIGQGQRVGIMAGSGVGKSVLLGMMVRAAKADVVVVGLIGERSREVSDFLETKLKGDARQRSVVVAVPANHSPVLRIRGALRATAIAEGFREQGKKVLLIIDSLTRVAHAGREIGLALGEPASARGYPPSAIAMLPGLIERAGTCVRSGGSITAIYTVLADGDDNSDPVVDSARSILDGHIVLSRQMAERGVYPAIDLGPSVSRVMTDIADKPHLAAARVLRRHLATFEENRDLVLMGAYRTGTDAAIDHAIAAQPAVMEYIRQDADEIVSLPDAVAELTGVFGDG